jgi:uncharacterized membrane-anchored protein
MQQQHLPAITPRYWTAILVASIFGTNMGDFYAHNSGLGLLGGLPILAVLFAVAYVAEKRDRLAHDAYYWFCIIVLRTGATNIADYCAGKRGLGIDRLVLTVGFGVLIAVLAWVAVRKKQNVAANDTGKALPETDLLYWVTMLSAGVFGTILGDYFEHTIGDGIAAIALTVALLPVLMIYWRSVAPSLFLYWATISAARTTGTAIGDWFADNEILNIGLARCTLATGIIFVALLVLWRDRRPAEPAVSAA